MNKEFLLNLAQTCLASSFEHNFVNKLSVNQVIKLPQNNKKAYIKGNNLIVLRIDTKSCPVMEVPIILALKQYNLAKAYIVSVSNKQISIKTIN